MTAIRSSRVAVLWVGEVRSFERTWSNYLSTVLLRCGKLHDPISVDLYLSSYDSPGLDRFQELYRPVHTSVENKEEVGKLAKELVSKMESLLYNKWPESRAVNIVSMFYNFDKAFKEFQKNKKQEYDYIVRFRDRLLLSHPLSLELLEQSDKGIVIPKFGDWRGGICDIFAAGKEEQMQKYFCGVLDNLESYLSQGCHFHPENILLWHLVSQRIKLARPVYTISLLQETHNKALDTTIYTTRQQ